MAPEGGYRTPDGQGRGDTAALDKRDSVNFGPLWGLCPQEAVSQSPQIL